jgi:hypothetical protein
MALPDRVGLTAAVEEIEDGVGARRRGVVGRREIDRKHTRRDTREDRSRRIEDLYPTLLCGAREGDQKGENEMKETRHKAI